MKQLFKVGQVVATRAIADQVETDPDYGLWIKDCFRRYVTGDWGDLGADDIQANDDAVAGDERILARYNHSSGDIYIITEWDRSYTTILFTTDY